MFLNELHVRFVQLYLVMSISKCLIFDCFLDIGRKVKKVEERDSAPPKKSPKLSKLAERGKRLATARKRSQRRRDNLKEQIDMLAIHKGNIHRGRKQAGCPLYLILCQEYPEAGKVWFIERKGAVLGRGPRVIYDLVTHWQKTREIIVHDPANRGRGSPKFVFRPKGFHPAVIEWLKARIESSLKAGRTVRVPWLAHDLFAEWKLASSPDPLRRPQEAGRGQVWPLRGPQRQHRPHIGQGQASAR